MITRTSNFLLNRHFNFMVLLSIVLWNCTSDDVAIAQEEGNEEVEETENDTVTAEPRYPNIVLIVADDLGWADVGFNGSEIMTPNLDQLSDEGVTLDRFYTSPICTPTRAGLLTGRYPDRYGLRNDVIRPWVEEGLDLNEQLLPEFLANQGYNNRAIIGKWHLGHGRWNLHPMNRGFTHFYGCLNGAIGYFNLSRQGERDWHEGLQPSPDEGYATDLITTKAVQKIEEYATSGSPFFLEVAYNAPHTPLRARREYLDIYGFDPALPRFDGSNSRGVGNSERQTYAAMVTDMDDGIGKIMDKLSSLGISNSSLVIFMSDNGADEKSKGGSSGMLRGEKLTEWEGGIRSPAIIRWPDAFDGGWRSDQLMSYVDIFPTIAGIIAPGMTTLNPMDGSNIIEVIESRGEKKITDRQLFVGNGVLISDEFKLIKDVNLNNNMSEVTEDLLFNIFQDPIEASSIKNSQSSRYNQLLQEIREFESIVPSFTLGNTQKPDGWRPPKDWIPGN
ncbi:MAG: arylsulfatase [Bacteroidota bacterium]